MATAAVALALLTAACSGRPAGSASSTSKPVIASAVPAIQVVGMGDSDASGAGDNGGPGWVGRYRDLLQEKVGQQPFVEVRNLAKEAQTSDRLRDTVLHSSSVRKALAGADVILIGIGGADLNAGDEAWGAGSCKGRACYTKILHDFDANIAAIAREAHRLAPQALLRAMSLPNAYPGAADEIPRSAIVEDASRYQVLSERDSVCRAMRANGGQCVDVVRAFNGADAEGDAYAKLLMTKDPCCYPSSKGQELIAEQLIAMGVPKRH